MGKIVNNLTNEWSPTNTKEIIGVTYDGVVFNKKTIYSDDRYYMIKGREKNYKKFLDVENETITSYNNSIISEHISSKIINLIAMDNDTKAHNTLLVNYNNNSYVACEHYLFNSYGENAAIKFHQLVTDQLLSEDSDDINKYTLNDLNNILKTIYNQKYIGKEKLLKRFWNQFALDTLLLNWDRHSGNWGLIYHKNLESFDLLPIFDQGSTLMSKLDSSAVSLNNRENLKSNYISHTVKTVDDLLYDNIEELRFQIIKNIAETTSAINIDGRRINYYNFIKSANNKDFFKSIKLLVDKVNLQEIFKLIEKELSFSKKYQDFYKLLISLSYNEIILKGLLENMYYQRWLRESNDKEDIISEQIN